MRSGTEMSHHIMEAIFAKNRPVFEHVEKRQSKIGSLVGIRDTLKRSEKGVPQKWVHYMVQRIFKYDYWLASSHLSTLSPVWFREVSASAAFSCLLKSSEDAAAVVQLLARGSLRRNPEPAAPEIATVCYCHPQPLLNAKTVDER